MQSDIISQISGFFGGKNRRKEVDLSSSKSQESLTIGELIAEKFRRKSESALAIEELANRKKNGTVKANGINLVRIAKLDFKLNLIKRLSLSDDLPPALPVRHFSVDGDEDLPPPIPERKSSLDTVIDEGFQRRFSFRPIATVPLPDPLSGIKKIYPSQTPRRNVLQRPPSQPPPPPPPPPTSDASPPQTLSSAPSRVTFSLFPRPSSQYDFEDEFDDDDFPPPPSTDATKGPSPPPPSATTKRTGMFWKSSAASHNISKASNEPPPPPARPLPPAPQSKKSDARYRSSPNLIPSEPPKHIRQTFHSTAKEMKRLKLKAARSEPNLEALDGLTPVSPPPIPARPIVLTPVFPQRPLRVTSANGKTPGNKGNERPKLPVKPSQNGSWSPPISSSGLRMEEGVTSKSRSGNNKGQPPALMPPARQPASTKPPPVTGVHNNRNRPLPTPPKHTDDKMKLKGKVGGQELYDPREEDGDLYDVMESTNI